MARMSSGGIERRLAAILSADVVGYSRLMAADESGTVRHITAYREQVGAFVREHRGRLVDFSGDCFLAEFSSPVDAAAQGLSARLDRPRLATQIEERLHARAPADRSSTD